MDEAVKYQQRLQAIAEKRRLQEEQERARRELEDEKLRLQQMKRKSLRDQWLMEGPSSTPNSPGPQSPLWGSQAQEIEERIDTLEATTQRLAEKEVKLNKLEDGETLNDTSSGTKDSSELRANTAGEQKEDGEARRDPEPALPSERVPQENGKEEQEDRSVMGAVVVQVQKDLKTGATTITSVTPIAPGETGPSGEVVFDDGSRSVHTADGAVAQLSPEELGQILSAGAVVGDVNGRMEGAPKMAPGENGLEEGKDMCAHPAEGPTQTEGAPHINGLPRDPGVADGADGQAPVTMRFLGFSEAGPTPDHADKDVGEIIRAERVIVTDEGDEPPDSETESAPEDAKDHVETPEPEVTGPHPEPGLKVPSEAEKAPEIHATQANGGEEEETKSEEGQTTEEVPGLEADILSHSTENEAHASQVPACSTAPSTVTNKPDVEEEGAGTDRKAEEASPALTVQPGNFQEVPLDGDVKQEVPREPELQPLMEQSHTVETRANRQTTAQPTEQHSLASPSKALPQTAAAAPGHAGGEGSPKHKSCQCCSVM